MRPWFDSWVGKIPWRRDRLPTPVFLGFCGGSDGEESICNVRDLGSVPRLGRSLGGGHDNPLQNSFVENLQGQKSLAGYSPGGSKDSDLTEWLCTASLPRAFQVTQWIHLPMQEMQVPSLSWEDPLEEEMSTDSNILAWEIPWTEEPGGLQSMGSQRVRHAWRCTHTSPFTRRWCRNLTFLPRQCPSYDRPRQSRKELADLRHHLLDGQGAEAWWLWARHFVIFSLDWENCYLAFEKRT